MSKKNLVRTVVLLGLVAWPSVEIYKYNQATKLLAERQALEQRVAFRFAQAQTRHAQVAKVSSEEPEKP